MEWFRKDGEPVTTDRFILVENDQGITGRIRINWTSQNQPVFSGGVYREENEYNPDGSICSSKTILLDPNPTIK